MFKHELLEKYPLERVDTPDGRYYKIIDYSLATLRDDWYYPSVTTVLSKYYPFDREGWESRVGKETADKISTQAKRRGNAMHKLYEDYLLNQTSKNVMPINLVDFNKVKPILNQNITKVYGVELPLFSNKLRLAGTCDAFVEWNGIPTLVDFKTSKKVKKINEIPSYLTQATIYSIMIEELYGIKVPDIIIIMTVDHEKDPLVFVEKTEDHISKVHEILKEVSCIS